MPTKENAKTPAIRIAIIGKFKRMHDEEYIARSFEALGHEVLRVPEPLNFEDMHGMIMEFRPKYVLYTKLDNFGDIRSFFGKLKPFNIKFVCWVFDLYFNYPREFRLKGPAFQLADFVFTTDGGPHDWAQYNIRHQCVRQGIYKPECYLEEGVPEGIAFVGSENNLCPGRHEQMEFLRKAYGDKFKWYGRTDTNEVRGTALNKLFANTKVVVGDSVYSPRYWSNRVVETLGRGGFLIHRDVPGIREEYPDLVTYDGTLADLKSKVDYYLSHEDERKEIVRKNFELVKANYTMDKKCAELLSKL